MNNTAAKIVKTAQAIIDGDVEMVWGCRDLMSLLYDNDVPKSVRHEPQALSIIGFVSETDNYPAGPSREHWDEAALKEMDARRDAYIATEYDSVIEDCRYLISKFTTVS